jgi:hypothetical protein
VHAPIVRIPALGNRSMNGPQAEAVSNRYETRCQALLLTSCCMGGLVPG